jgi:hypothetical protein
MFSVSQFVPLISTLGGYLKDGINHYADLRAVGDTAGPDVVATYLELRMKDWNPKIGKATLLDDPTRAAAARFLAGVAVNFARA